MKRRNSHLTKAREVKNDEFYTQLADIEAELQHYDFRGKVVYCNCDDPHKSNFFKYFVDNFETLGLKGVLASCYKERFGNLFIDVDAAERATWAEYDGNEVIIKELKQDGDFRTKECIALLQRADVVVSNPPFSLFREYLAQLVAYDKEFLVIGSLTAIVRKHALPLVVSKRLWLGVNRSGHSFVVPDDTTSFTHEIDGVKYAGVISRWFTNLNHNKRADDLELTKKYNEDDYPRFDNYDAINVDKVSDIPMDYDGKMGVPITFMDSYNPDQFEIIGLDEFLPNHTGHRKKFAVGGKHRYARLVIRNKRPQAR